MNAEKNAKAQYKEAWRQARLLGGAVIWDERERQAWEIVHSSALNLHGIPQEVGAAAREHLRFRNAITIQA